MDGTRSNGVAGDAALASSGDTAAFERLYRATVARVHTLARRFLGEADADDATQEAYVLAWRRLSTFRGESRFETWLLRVALNSFASRARRKDAVPPAAEREPEAPPRDRDAALDLESAIARLPDGARRVFVLHDVLGRTHDEIASDLGVSAGTSKSQLHRARRLLRAALGREGGLP
jgi:RNA polymerase sigma-70 factor (ECF subfamily)